MPTERTVEEQWYQMLTEGEPINRHLYHLYGLLPSDPRCKMCAAPFGGLRVYHAPARPRSIQVQSAFLPAL